MCWCWLGWGKGRVYVWKDGDGDGGWGIEREGKRKGGRVWRVWGGLMYLPTGSSEEYNRFSRSACPSKKVMGSTPG